MNLFRLSRSARTEAAALSVAALGIIIQIIGGLAAVVAGIAALTVRSRARSS